MFKLKKIAALATSFVVSTTMVGAIVLPLASNTKPVLKTSSSSSSLSQANNDLFLIENDEVKGFKPDVTQEQIKEYTSDGVLRLPAVKTISADAFNTTLKGAPFGDTIEISAETETIGERAFYGNTASTITFTGGVASSNLKTISKSAFAFCKNLKSFTFPPKMFSEGTVGKQAFFNCTSLTELDCTQYDGTYEFVDTNWSHGAFRAMSQSGKMVFNGDDSTATAAKSNYAKAWTRFAVVGLNPAWTENWNSTTSKPEWSEEVKVVPDEFLTFNTDKTTWTGINPALWPTTHTGFTTINFPSTVTSINIGTSFDWAARSSVKTWDFSNTKITTIPESFMYNAGLSSTEVLLPNTVTTINTNAFYNSGVSVTLADNTVFTSVGDSAFRGITNITSVKFSSSATSIGSYAFEGCTGLTSIDFSALDRSNSLTIGSNAFTNTGSSSSASSHIVKLQDISSSTTKIDQLKLEVSFKTKLNNAGMTIGQTSSNTWTLNSTISLAYTELFDISNGVLNGWAKDASGTQLTTTELNTALGKLGITTLTFPSGVTSIADNAFYDTTNSKSTIPSCIKTITFQDSNVTSIGKAAFKCLPEGITTFTLGTSNSKLVTIGEEAFYQLPSTITSFNLTYATALTTISKKAFYGMKFTKDSQYGEFLLSNNTSLTTIGDDAFACSPNITGCLWLITDGSSGSTITSIGNGAFYGCNFTELYIPLFTGSVSIGKMAFADNNNLAAIDMSNYSSAPTTSWTVGDDALSGIASTGELYVSSSATAGTILNYLKNYSYEISLGGWEEY